MKDKAYPAVVEREKVISIFVLFAVSTLITLAGAFFSVFSLVNSISLPILSSQIPGVVFGLVILLLGIRYFISVKKLKAEVYKSTAKFSWSNFRKKK